MLKLIRGSTVYPQKGRFLPLDSIQNVRLLTKLLVSLIYAVCQTGYTSLLCLIFSQIR